MMKEGSIQHPREIMEREKKTMATELKDFFLHARHHPPLSRWRKPLQP
jgi:hypothetical protein